MKETILQFGTGVFLRGFLADFVQTLNEKGLYDGKIVAVQPTNSKRGRLINECGGEHSLFLRGIVDGESVVKHRRIKSLTRCVDPYENYEAYLALAGTFALSCPTQLKPALPSTLNAAFMTDRRFLSPVSSHSFFIRDTSAIFRAS